MKARWPEVKLGEVLRKADTWISATLDTTYKEATVRLWGRGVVLRREVPGSEVAGQRRLQVQRNQFILSRIDARNGAIGLVPDELDSAIVTNDFPTFDVNGDRLLPEFLGWLSKTKGFVESCRHASEGTTNRVRLKEDKFLQLAITLPSLPEQRRIVAKIEQLAEFTHDARFLQEQAAMEISAIVRAASHEVFQRKPSTKEVPLSSVCLGIIDCLHSNPVFSDQGVPTVRSPDVGWGKLNLSSALQTTEEDYAHRIRRGAPAPGDIIVVREGGSTGKAGIVEEGQKFSLGQRVMQLRPNLDVILPQFLLYQWLSPRIQDEHIAELSKGSASPHLNIGSVKKFPVLLPSFDDQRRIVAHLNDLQSQVDRVSDLKEKTTAALDALLPSILDKAFQGDL